MIRARTTTRADVEIALVQRDGTAWGLPLVVDDEWQDIAIPLSRLQRVPLVLLPRPYPTFQPYSVMTTTSVDTSNPATDRHFKTGHHDDGLRLVIGSA